MTDISNASDLFLNKAAQIFLKAAQTSSFTEAGERFGMTQSAVSRIIKHWEDEWRVPLFERNSRPVRLTPEGQVLKQELEKYVLSFGNLAQNIRQENKLKPLIRIGCIESLSVDLLPKLIIRLRNKTRQLVSVVGTSDVLHQKLLSGELDVIFSSDSTVDLANLKRQKIFQEGSLLVFPRKMENSKCWKSWDSLKFCGLPFLKYHHSSGGGKLNEVFLDTSGISFPHQLEVDSNSTMLALISEGVGWTVARASTILQNKNFMDKVTYRPMPAPLLSRKVYVLARRNEPEILMNTFIEEACRILREDILKELVDIAPWMKQEIFVLDPETKLLKNIQGKPLKDS